VSDVYKMMVDALHRKLSENGIDSEKAASMAIDAVEQVSHDVGGQRLYLPKRPPWFSRTQRDDCIKRQFNGRNYRSIAQAFCLSERTVRRICKK